MKAREPCCKNEGGTSTVDREAADLAHGVPRVCPPLHLKVKTKDDDVFYLNPPHRKVKPGPYPRLTERLTEILLGLEVGEFLLIKDSRHGKRFSIVWKAIRRATEEKAAEEVTFAKTQTWEQGSRTWFVLRIT